MTNHDNLILKIFINKTGNFNSNKTRKINKYPNIEELFYENYEEMVEKYGLEISEIFRKCLDIIWFEARE